MAHYWWNSQQQGSPVHWVAWDRLKYLKKEGGLGFRDIEKFNLALLAKQAWRILQNPHCLLARTLRGRYFSDTNILNASRGTQSSYGWQSILLGRNLLQKGLRFTIGNGELIQTWIDPWLPTHPPRPPRKASEHLDAHLQVKNFILADNTGWNVRKVREQIHQDDVSHVLSIKLSVWQNLDYLGWHYTDDGLYTVKSGYWLATHLPNIEAQVHPPHGDPQLKSAIWKTRTPPKMKHFLWRLLSRALATGNELARRHITTDALCKRCVTEIETPEHLFFTCPHALQVWRASNIPLRCLLNPSESLETKLKTILNFHNHGKHYDRIAHLPFWILWKLWTSRNKLTFQRQSHSWIRDLREARQETDEWLTIDDTNHSSGHNTSLSRTIGSTPRSWQPPPSGWVKCNYDGSFVNRNSRSTTAWIIRNAQGQFCEAGQVTGTHVLSAIEAECQALLHAMHKTLNNGYTKVIFEGDCQSLISALNGQGPRFDIFNWLQDIRGWANCFEEIIFKWTPRKLNFLADKLAKSQRSSPLPSVFHTSVPVCIRNYFPCIQLIP